MAIMEFLLILLVFAIGSKGFVLEDKTKNPGIFKSSDIKLIKPVTISPKFNLHLPNSIGQGNRIYDINFNSFKNNLLSGKLVKTNIFKKSDDDLTIVDMINSSPEPTSIEPIIKEISIEQTTQKESPNITKETLTHLESENLQYSEPNMKVKKWIVDHQEIPTDNFLEPRESSDNIKGVLSRTQNEIEQPSIVRLTPTEELQPPEVVQTVVESLQHIHQISQEPIIGIEQPSIVRLTPTEEPQPQVIETFVENLQQMHQISLEPILGIQNESIIHAKNENAIINLVNNDIEAETEKLKEIPTTEEFSSMELITDKPTVKLSAINPALEITQSIEPQSNIQRKEKIHSFSDIISNTLLAIYESQPKTIEIKETAGEEEIVGAVYPIITSENLSSEPNYKAKSTKRSISDELNRNQQMLQNFGPTTRQPAAKKRNLLEKLENETSAERQERWNKSLQHMMTAVSVMGQIDKFISGRIKSGVKMVAKMYDDEDEQIRSRRNSFF